MPTTIQPRWLHGWEIRKRPTCELLWVALPLLAQRVSRKLAAVVVDGAYLAAWPDAGALLPPVALLLGVACGWFHPGIDAALYQSGFILGAALLLAALSGQLGLLFAVGYALGDILLGAPKPPGADASTLGSLASAVPPLIEYLALGILAAQLALLSKALAQQLPLPRRLQGAQRLAAIALLEAAAAAMAAWGWVRALPIVLRPGFSWHGLGEPADAIESVQGLALGLAGMVALVTLVRIALQHRSARSAAGSAQLDRLDRLRQSVPAAARPLAERIPPPAMLAIEALLAVTMLAGLIEAWLDAAFALAVVGGVQAARKGLLPVLGPWPAIAARIPALVRTLAGVAVLALAGPALLSSFFATADAMRPMLFMALLGLVVFLLLLPPAPEPRQAADKRARP